MDALRQSLKETRARPGEKQAPDIGSQAGAGTAKEGGLSDAVVAAGSWFA